MIATGQKSGYLDVKVPAKARGKGIKAWKAWKRRWVVVHGLTNVTTNNPVVTIDMYSHENREGHQLERSTIYLERVIGIFRSLSRSHVYSFSVEAQETLLYLSGYSETDSQKWIAALRCILWPPTAKPMLECTIGDVFKVSIIENLSSFVSRSRIASTVGYMITLPSVILLASLSTGSILVEWPWQFIHRAVLMDVTCPEDTGKILCVEICSDVSTSGIYYFFSEKADEISRILVRHIVPCRTFDRNSICSARSSQTLDCPMSTSSSSIRSTKVTALRTYRKVSEDVTGSRRYTSADLTQLQASARLSKSKSVEYIEPETSASNLKMEELSEKKAKMAQDGVAQIRQRTKRKLPVILQPLVALSFDNIPLRVAVSSGGSLLNDVPLKLDRRKSSSESALTSCTRTASTCRDSQQLRKQSMSALSVSNTENNSDYEEIPVFETVNSGAVIQAKQNPKLDTTTSTSTICKRNRPTPLSISTEVTSSRPQSVYSCASQVSRDSGVMSSTPEDKPSPSRNKSDAMSLPFAEQQSVSPFIGRKVAVRRRSTSESRGLSLEVPAGSPYGHPVSPDESRHYRKFTDFIADSANRDLENSLAQRLSTSSDSTLYSEIDVFPDGSGKSNMEEDPLYEDLDKFRKNIHKLLGIPHSQEQQLSGNQRSPSPVATTALDQPPPLPPRKYSKSSGGSCTNALSKKLSMQEVQPPRRKDVMKYLGVDKEKLFGSLDKLNSAGKTVNVVQKRKDIYRYLGIPSMAASQPAGLNSPSESNYDCPPSTRRQNSLIQGRIEITSSSPSSMDSPISPRRSSRTYVKAQSSATLPASLQALPKLDPKPSKKRRMVFLKRKTSTKKLIEKTEEAVGGSTYVSYDSCDPEDWDDIRNVKDAGDSREKSQLSKAALTNRCEVPITVKDATEFETRNLNKGISEIVSVDEQSTVRHPQHRHSMPLHRADLQKERIQNKAMLSIRSMSEPISSTLNEAYSVPSTIRISATQQRSKDALPLPKEPDQPFYVNLNELQKPSVLRAIFEDDAAGAQEEIELQEVMPKMKATVTNSVDVEQVNIRSTGSRDALSELLLVECDAYQDSDRDSSASIVVDSNYMVMTGSPIMFDKHLPFSNTHNYRSNSVYMEMDFPRDNSALNSKTSSVCDSSDELQPPADLEGTQIRSLQNSNNKRTSTNAFGANAPVVDDSVVTLRNKSRTVPLICINDEPNAECESLKSENVDVSQNASSTSRATTIDERVSNLSEQLVDLSMNIDLSDAATVQELKRLMPDLISSGNVPESDSYGNYAAKLMASLMNSIKCATERGNDKYRQVKTDDHRYSKDEFLIDNSSISSYKSFSDSDVVDFALGDHSKNNNTKMASSQLPCRRRAKENQIVQSLDSFELSDNGYSLQDNESAAKDGGKTFEDGAMDILVDIEQGSPIELMSFSSGNDDSEFVSDPYSISDSVADKSLTIRDSGVSLLENDNPENLLSDSIRIRDDALANRIGAILREQLSTYIDELFKFDFPTEQTSVTGTDISSKSDAPHHDATILDLGDDSIDNEVPPFLDTSVESKDQDDDSSILE